MKVVLVGPPSVVAKRIERDLLDHRVLEHVERVTDPDGSIAEGDLVVSVQGGEQEVEGASRAIRAGGRYLSTMFDPELAQKLEPVSGTGSVVLAGWSPGLTTLLASKAVSELDEVRGIRIAWSNSAAGPEGSTALATTTEALSATAVVFDGASWRRERSGSHPESIYFPPPLGWKNTHLAASSEAGLLPSRNEDLRWVRVQGGASEAAAVALARMGSTQEPSSTKGALLKKLGPLVASRRSGGIGWSSVRADAYGPSGEVVTIAVLDRWINMVAAMVTTTVELLNDRTDLAPGVLLPSDVFSPDELLSGIRSKGVLAARLMR